MEHQENCASLRLYRYYRRTSSVADSFVWEEHRDVFAARVTYPEKLDTKPEEGFVSGLSYKASASNSEGPSDYPEVTGEPIDLGRTEPLYKVSPLPSAEVCAVHYQEVQECKVGTAGGGISMTPACFQKINVGEISPQRCSTSIDGAALGKGEPDAVRLTDVLGPDLRSGPPGPYCHGSPTCSVWTGSGTGSDSDEVTVVVANRRLGPCLLLAKEKVTKAKSCGSSATMDSCEHDDEDDDEALPNDNLTASVSVDGGSDLLGLAEQVGASKDFLQPPPSSCPAEYDRLGAETMEKMLPLPKEHAELLSPGSGYWRNVLSKDSGKPRTLAYCMMGHRATVRFVKHKPILSCKKCIEASKKAPVEITTMKADLSVKTTASQTSNGIAPMESENAWSAKCTALEAEAFDLRNENKSLEKEILDLKKNLSQLEQLFAAEKAHCASFKEANIELDQAWSAKCQALKAELKTMRDEVSVLNANCQAADEAWSAKCSAVSADLEQAREEVSSFVIAKSELLKSTEEEVNMLKDQAKAADEAWSRRCEALVAELESMRVEATSWKSENGILHEEANDTAGEVWKVRCEDVASELESIREEVCKLRVENEQLKWNGDEVNRVQELEDLLQMKEQEFEGFRRRQQELVAEVTCPITHSIIKTPVVCSDGFLYEKSAITRWLHRRGTSPISREAVEPGLKECLVLERIVKLIAQGEEVAAAEDPEEWGEEEEAEEWDEEAAAALREREEAEAAFEQELLAARRPLEEAEAAFDEAEGTAIPAALELLRRRLQEYRILRTEIYARYNMEFVEFEDDETSPGTL